MSRLHDHGYIIEFKVTRVCFTEYPQSMWGRMWDCGWMLFAELFIFDICSICDSVVPFSLPILFFKCEVWAAEQELVVVYAENSLDARCSSHLTTIELVSQLPMCYIPAGPLSAVSNKYFHFQPTQFDQQIETNAIYIPQN